MFKIKFVYLEILKKFFQTYFIISAFVFKKFGKSKRARNWCSEIHIKSAYIHAIGIARRLSAAPETEKARPSLFVQLRERGHENVLRARLRCLPLGGVGVNGTVTLCRNHARRSWHCENDGDTGRENRNTFRTKRVRRFTAPRRNIRYVYSERVMPIREKISYPEINRYFLSLFFLFLFFSPNFRF